MSKQQHMHTRHTITSATTQLHTYYVHYDTHTHIHTHTHTHQAQNWIYPGEIYNATEIKMLSGYLQWEI